MSHNRLPSLVCLTPTGAPPASRASWVGRLQIGHIIVPVKAYSTIASQDAALHQVHAGCGRRIQYSKTCPKHGTLCGDEIAKGYSCDSDHTIELSKTELARVAPTDKKTICLERFIDECELDLILLSGRSLFLACGDPIACQLFAAVIRALGTKKKWALGRVVFSGSEQLVVVYPREGTLILHSLHYPERQRALIEISGNGTAPRRSDVRAIASIIESESRPLVWSEYQDRSTARLIELVQKKVAATSQTASKRTNGKPLTSSNGRAKKKASSNGRLSSRRKAA